MSTLFMVNPRSKRRRGKSRKHRSAAQRAATARLVALNKGFRRNPRRKSRKASRRKQRGFAVMSAPRVHRLRRRARRAFESMRSHFAGGGIVGSASSLLKAGAIGGAGAVAVDVGMSYVRSYLPSSMTSPVNADGSANFGYFGAKAALAIALGVYGRRIPKLGAFAGRMAEGALTVMAYQLMRPMVPANMLGAYMNPAPTMRAGVSGLRSVRGVAAYPALPVRASASAGKGARASAVLSAVGTARQIHSEGYQRATPG